MSCPAPIRPFLHLLACLTAVLGAGACLFWPETLEPNRSSSGPPDPPSLESRSRAMLEQAVYIPFTEDRSDWVLRRCSQSGEQHRCDLVFVHAGAVTRTVPAYHRSQRYTRAEHDIRAEQLAEQLDDLDMDDEYLTVRRRDVTTVRLSAAYGAPSYLVTLREGLLEIAYEATREQDWVQPLAAVRFGGEVRLSAAFSSFGERRLVAFEIRHETKTGSTTSWVVFRRAETKMAGQIFVVPSREGLIGKVVAVTQKRRLKRRAKPAPPPRPSPVPLATPSASAPPTASAPVVIATGDGGIGGAPAVGASERPCQTQKDCPAEYVCEAPEESSWNACGAPRQPQCPEGFTGDSCGHCFRVCSSDADCRGGRRCNGAGGPGYCISARRCTTPPPRRP